MTRPLPMDAPDPGVRPVEPARRIPTLADDARRHLFRRPRSLPPKYFYDERGSVLFDRICDTPEYYPTRAERRLLEASAGEIARLARPDHLFELGSGTSRKTRVLLTACQERGVQPVYWPFDVSEAILVSTACALRADYPWLRIRLLVGDYSGGLTNLPEMPGSELCLFLGGTIGNFTGNEAEGFLREIAGHLDGDDRLLIGFDRVKDRGILEAAYNDSQGLTAAFNRNVLAVLNRELGADFDIGGFRHEAIYNEALDRIEMYLISRRPQTVRFGELQEAMRLEEGEKILTEISRKFTRHGLEALLEAGGFELEKRFDAPDEWYSLALASKR